MAAELTVNLLDLAPLLDALAEAFVVVDRSGTILTWNATATALFGWTPAHALGRSLHDLLFPDRAAANSRAAVTLLSTHPANRGVPAQCQTLSAARRDGGRIPIEVTIRALPGATGSQICISLVDLSAQATARDETQRMTQILQSVLDNLDTPVFVCDPDGDPIFANWALRQLTATPGGTLNQIVAAIRRHLTAADGSALDLNDYPSSRALAGRAIRGVPLRLAMPGDPFNIFGPMRIGSSSAVVCSASPFFYGPIHAPEPARRYP
ncbi:PAS domain-containing protein [Cryptosporangium phraense]|uniref:PAS domain-containing protein n=1 Tax=Cryptosporangium phraense TaxID=2593070 RepID=A0A545AEN9_9ACTN|nr:PAS domain-containing protein [Cryptosporangium phraense]TQS39792.1 PAS domain-containing protein [Cryptosporangium phraense]